MKKHFYICRHGQSIWNAEGRPHGQHPDPVPLSITGKEQALNLANILKDKKIKIIISSDLLRAKQTADIIANVLNVDVVTDKRLREIDYGILNGVYTIEREEIFPDFKRCYQDPDFPFPNGECYTYVGKRFKQAIEEFTDTYSYRNMLIVTHGHAIDAFLISVFGYRYNALKNCEYIHITYDNDKKIYEAIELPDKKMQMNIGIGG